MGSFQKVGLGDEADLGGFQLELYHRVGNKDDEQVITV